MADKLIYVLSLNPTGKVPGAKLQVNFGQTPVGVGQIPRTLLLIGNKVATAATGNPAGTASVDNVVYDILSSTDVDGLFGMRSELARMIRVARLYKSIRIKAIACAESTGVQASMTLTVPGAATANGTHRLWFGGQGVEVNVLSGATAAAQATAIANAINQKPNLPVYATVAGAVVTILAAHPGTRGNDLTVYRDPSSSPTGSLLTLTSASSYVVQPGPGGVVGVRLAGGTGNDDLTNVLAALQGQTFFTIGAAQVDSANLVLLKAYDDAKAVAGSQRFEHVALGYNGLLTPGITLSDSVNKERFCDAWVQGCEVGSPELAASFGAMRTAKEQSHPNRRYNGDVLLGIPPQRSLLDRPDGLETGVQQAALDAGLTPCTTTADGDVVVVRAITMKHFKTVNGNQIPFYGTLDCGAARGPDMFAEQLQLSWDTEFGANNEWVAPDPAPGEPNPNAGVATPRMWTGHVLALGKEAIDANWFLSVECTTVYDRATKSLLCTIEVEPMPLNHRVGGNVNQV